MDFDPYLERWKLTPDGEAIVTHSSRLLPVRREGESAMLKLAQGREERWGAGLMVWWGGEGAARVLEHDAPALLMERAMGERSLSAMAHAGLDDEASRIICRVAEGLHRKRERPLPELLPLERWFEKLHPAARRYGGPLARAASVADSLLRSQREVTVLHGDLHHGNVLDFGERGWLAIDPKRLGGERTFDFVNLLRNPDPVLALEPGRFHRQLDVIARAAKLDRRRLLEWTLAFTGLSAAWILSDGDEPELDLSVCALATAALDA